MTIEVCNGKSTQTCGNCTHYSKETGRCENVHSDLSLSPVNDSDTASANRAYLLDAIAEVLPKTLGY